MRTINIAIVTIIILLLTACNTNPLLRPFDTAINETLGPYVEEKLTEDLESGKRSEAFVTAKRLEIQALRELIEEAKGEAE